MADAEKFILAIREMHARFVAPSLSVSIPIYMHGLNSDEIEANKAALQKMVEEAARRAEGLFVNLAAAWLENMKQKI